MTEQHQARLDRQEFHNLMTNKTRAFRHQAPMALAMVDAMLRSQDNGPISQRIAQNVRNMH